MAIKILKNQFAFRMSAIDYDVLQKFFLTTGGTMATFLRAAIRDELQIGEIEHKSNQILELGQSTRLKTKRVNVLLNDNDSFALKNYLKNSNVSISVFCRYLTKKELARLKIYNAEKNQTWDLD